MKKTHLWTLILIISFVFLFSIRFANLTADPPYDLSQSGAPWGDPGGYSFNARNKVLFGTWEVDNYNMMYTSYPPHLATYTLFRLLGVGFAQQNAVPVLFSCLSLIFFFLILRRQHPIPASLLGVSLLGINYLFLMFSRIADRIMPVVFFLLLGIYLLEKAKEKPLWHIGAGMSFALALVSRSLIFYAVAGILAGYLLYMLFNQSFKNLLFRAGLLLSGALAIMLPWMVFIYLPKHEYIISFGKLNVSLLLPPANATKLLAHFWTRPPLLLENMPIITILGAIFSLVLVYKAIHKPKTLQPTDWMFLGWYLFGFLYLALIYQRFPRRFIALIVPVTFMAFSLIRMFLDKKNRRSREKPKILFLPLLFLWMLFPASYIIKFLWNNSHTKSLTQTDLNITLLILSTTMTVLLYFLISFMAGKKSLSLRPILKNTSLLLLAVLFLYSHGHRYLRWALDPPFQLKEISQDYGKAFQKAVFVGLWAPVISLENSHKAHEYFRRYINSYKDLFEKYGITHVFTTTHHGEDENFRQDYPQVMKKAKLLARYHIWTVQVLLYDVHPALEKQEPGIFEAELYTQKGNTPRYDRDAYGNFAVLCRSKKPITMISILPDRTYQKGTYEIFFRVRSEIDISAMTARAGRLVASSPLSRKILAHKDLFPQDLNSKGYQDIVLTLPLRKASPLEFRMYSDGKGPIWIDRVKIRRK